MPLPEKLDPCPLLEAIAEFRFLPTIPLDAVFGALYGPLVGLFGGEVKTLPQAQIPEGIRNSDPNLMYAATHRIDSGDYVLQVGPRVFTISNINTYNGWGSFVSRIMSVVKCVRESSVVSNFETVTLRYINFFEFDIFPKSSIDIALRNERIANSKMQISTEFVSDGFTQQLAVVNYADVPHKMKRGSVVDIATAFKVVENTEDALHKNLVEAHTVTKELFFNVLSDDYVKTIAKTVSGGGGL